MGCLTSSLSSDITCDAGTLQKYYQCASINAAPKWTTFAFTYNYDWNASHIAYPGYRFDAPKRCLSWHVSHLEFTQGCKIKLNRELYHALCN